MNCTFECPICMQGPKRDMVWQMVEECGHVFCSACISTHLNRNKWCPLCKASVHHCMKPEDALIKVYLPLKYGDDHEGRNAQSPEDAKDLANLPETQVTDRPELAQTSGKKRKTYYCFMQEIEQRNKTIRYVSSYSSMFSPSSLFTEASFLSFSVSFSKQNTRAHTQGSGERVKYLPTSPKRL